MTAIAHSQLLGLVIQALQTPAPVAAWVQRMTMRPLPEGVATGVIARLRGGAGTEMVCSGAPRQWRCVVEVECLARATPAQSADEAAASVVEAVFGRITTAGQAGGLLQAAGYQMDGDITLNWDADAADERIGAASLMTVWTWRSGSTSLAMA